MKPKQLTSNQKALAINLEPKLYGTLAEIGAGQEVARYFFQAGGAAGTIAKSMSAYDMKFSDAIYGKATRYVSKERMTQMLRHEFRLLEERLKETRGSETCFFVFADTVAARSYKGNNECHGWMGMRFQLKPEAEPNEIYMHVRMLDKTNQDQQVALGIIGVNLVYATFFYYSDINRFVESLEDNIGKARIEVDMLEVHGPDFENVNNHILSLKLVEQGLTNAVMFGPKQQILQPSEFLYKKCCLIERGSFRPITKVNLDMIECAAAQFLQEPKVQGEDVIVLFEITINNLLSSGGDYEDLLCRCEVLNSLGYNVLISDYAEYYKLSAYIRRYTDKMMGIALGINLLLEIFNEEYYTHLEGGILEACGRLFKENMKMYIYPIKGSMYNQYMARTKEGFVDKLDSTRFAADTLITAQNLQVHQKERSLYTYLLENHFIEALVGYDTKLLDVFSKHIFEKMIKGESGWEDYVPPEAVKIIKEKNLWR